MGWMHPIGQALGEQRRRELVDDPDLIEKPEHNSRIRYRLLIVQTLTTLASIGQRGLTGTSTP